MDRRRAAAKRGFEPLDRGIHQFDRTPFSLCARAGVLWGRLGDNFASTLKRRRPLDRETLLELTIFSTSIIIASFFKSAIRNNDLGWRGLMFAQFVLIVWGSDYIFYLFESYRKKIAGSPERYWGGSKPPKIRWAVLILVVLGSISTLGDLVLMRFFHVFAQNRAELTFEDFDPLLKKNTRRIRETFRWIHRQTPADAIIQTNPSEDINIFAGIYSARQLALADRHNSKIFGIPTRCLTLLLRLSPACSVSSLIRQQLKIFAINFKSTGWCFSTQTRSGQTAAHGSGISRLPSAMRLQRFLTAAR